MHGYYAINWNSGRYGGRDDRNDDFAFNSSEEACAAVRLLLNQQRILDHICGSCSVKTWPGLFSTTLSFLWSLCLILSNMTGPYPASLFQTAKIALGMPSAFSQKLIRAIHASCFARCASMRRIFCFRS